MEIVKTQDDFHISVEKALAEIEPNFSKYPGVLITGSHTPTNIQKKQEILKHARESGVPTLGVCLGMQLMVIEYARNVKNLKVTSEEFGDDDLYVITKLPELRVGIKPVVWDGGTRMESHWHNYALKKEYASVFLTQDWEISYTEDIAEVIQLKNHPFYLGIQWHPEYQSSRDRPHPLLVKFLDVCKSA